MADEKQHLRQLLRECRKTLSAGRARTLSERIQMHLLDAEFYHSAGAIVLYASSGNEVATEAIFADSIRNSRPVYFPRSDANHGPLSLCRVHSWAELRSSAFGILEPDIAPACSLTDIGPALICVPALAFANHKTSFSPNSTGQRLGRGGGHYDRLLTEIPAQWVRVGLSYAFQLLDQLPQSDHDQQMDFLVTEFAVHRCARARSAAGAPLRADSGG